MKKKYILWMILFVTLLFPCRLIFAAPPSGSAYDPSTGVTTTVQGHEDGSRTVTKTDSDGHVIETRTEPPRGSGRAEGSSTDPKTGVTTHVEKNPDGTTTVTKTDASGKEISKDTVSAPGSEQSSGSSYDPSTGVTTSSVRNADGSHTITKTDANGKEISKTTELPAGTPHTEGSLTNLETGVTTTIVVNPDGTKTITQTGRDGNVIPPPGGEKPKEQPSEQPQQAGPTTPTGTSPASARDESFHFVPKNFWDVDNPDPDIAKRELEAKMWHTFFFGTPGEDVSRSNNLDQSMGVGGEGFKPVGTESAEFGSNPSPTGFPQARDGFDQETEIAPREERRER